MEDIRESGPQQPEEQKSEKRKRKKPFWRETTETVVGALLIALLTRGAIAEPRYIPSGSMLPTLEINDRLIVEKISNYTHRVQRGDILVFYPPDESLLSERELADHDSMLKAPLRWLGLTGEDAYIKRVVGLPGETVEVRDGQVYINNQPLNEPYIKEPPFYNMAAQKIPEGHLFMMGDNRNNSADSHVWGPLPIDNIIGHASFRFWPPDRLGTL